LFEINNGILMTPFHNMALMSPSATEDDIDHHTLIFRKCVENLTGIP
jgi:glutamate-1-semialdehyde 2,1-aminomutase